MKILLNLDNVIVRSKDQLLCHIHHLVQYILGKSLKQFQVIVFLLEVEQVQTLQLLSNVELEMVVVLQYTEQRCVLLDIPQVYILRLEYYPHITLH